MSPANAPSTPFPLSVRQQGKGFPILCLHGHPGSADCMGVFTDSLSEQFWTIAPDLRGYGKSRTRTPFTMQDHLTDLEALLDRLGIEECPILGWSLGGILAMELALRNPTRFPGLILVGTAARPISNLPPPTALELLFTLLAGGLNWLKPGWHWNIDTFGRQSLLKYLLAQHNPTAYRFLARAGGPATVKTSRHAHNALNRALAQHYNRIPDLAALDCPCLVLSGAEDRHILTQASYETAQHLKNSQWICYPETAHLFPWEIPARVNRDIQEWLRTHFNAEQGRL
ncbi:alpha/beta fold hydrolase [Altericista sp. CCNU0014]|uniref:alpha/beta fold hydrolase n=1 Tax=Altericista sp. CCNU0014 TaxID=3082949 RepID=UPI00384FE7E0